MKIVTNYTLVALLTKQQIDFVVHVYTITSSNNTGNFYINLCIPEENNS